MAVYNRDVSGPKIKNVLKGAEKRAYDSYHEEKCKNSSSDQTQKGSEANSSTNENNNDPLNSKKIYHNFADKYTRTKEILSGIPQAIANKDGYTPELQDSLSKTTRNFSGSIRSGIIMPIRQMKNDIEHGMSGGMAQAYELDMMKDVGRLGASLVVDAVMQSGNKNAIQKIKSQQGITEDNVNTRMTVQNLKDTHQILYKNGITKNENFKLRSEKDLRNLTNQMDLYFVKSGRGKLSSMENGKLEKLRDDLLEKKDQTSQQMAKLVDERIKINKTVEQKGFKIERNKKNIKRRLKRVTLSPFNRTDAYRGYLALNQTKFALTATTKAVILQYKMLYKGFRYGIGAGSKGTQFILRKTGNTNLMKVADGVQHLTAGTGGLFDFGEKTLSGVFNIPNKINTKLKTSRSIAADRIKSTPQIIKRSQVYKNTKRKIKTTKVGKKIRTANIVAKKTKKMLIKTKPIKTVRTIGKVVGQGLKAPFKLLGMAGRGISSASAFFLNLMVHVLKIILGVVLIAGVITTVSTMLISILMIIGDAVSDNYEKFRTETTMGATYEKLLKKEQEFNEAVLNLTDTIPVPEGYSNYGITKYTNSYVHYIGADGLEISGASNGYIPNVNMTPSEVSDTIWTYLKGKGWKDISIAALMGNIQRESAMNPAAVESNGVGFGLCQWSFSRRTALENYARKKGKAATDIYVQLDYIEAEPDENGAYVKKFKTKNFASVAVATEEFMNQWEKCAPGTSGLTDVRIPYAKKYYDYYTSNPDFSDIPSNPDLVPDPDSDSDAIISYASSANTTTIKGILSMAAVYIEQDFNKYGAFTNGIFADSLYKDYCAKLYDSTHIIGIDQTPQTVYYCPSLSATEGEPKYRAATNSCNNKMPGGKTENDWLNSGTGSSRKFTLSLSKEEDSYDYESGTDSTGTSITKTSHYDRYEINETGPHGKVVYEYERSGGNTASEARKTLIERGCKNYTKVCLDQYHGGGTYAYVCHCDECRGHIDANAYVFISNIYDPSSETYVPESDSSSQDENATYNESGYDNIDKKNQEYKYSMYALDKYATAFDAPNKGSKWVSCTNPSCSHYNVNTGYAEAPENMIEITENQSKCPECNTLLIYPKIGRTGDQESCDIADITKRHDAESFVLEDVTGLPMKIVDWWKNDGWFDNLSTTKTYFRLPNLSESIDTLKSDVNSEDCNVVNKNNSKPYWFDAFTSKSGRNMAFEKFGWNEDSIMMVRMLMASDWMDLYGIKNFGYIQGSPMTPAQIAQLIANNPEWHELCDDRKNIMAQALLFQQKAQTLDLRYVLGGAHPAKISDIKKGDSFDCSGYISCILYNSGLFSPSVTSTSGLNDSPYLRRLKPGESMLPGDILLKYKGSQGVNGNGNHVVLYMGNDRISEAKGKRYPIASTFNQPGAKAKLMSGYFVLRPTNIDENKHTINISDITGNSEDDQK